MIPIQHPLSSLPAADINHNVFLILGLSYWFDFFLLLWKLFFERTFIPTIYYFNTEMLKSTHLQCSL